MTIIQNCRACGETELLPILSLGNTPLANSLRSKNQIEEAEKTYPLELVFCPSCTLVQITETVDPEELFRHYLYFSSFSDTMIAHAAELSRRLIAELKLNSDSMVVEIASNDGYLLKNYASRGIPVLGIEPAKNVASAATEKGIRTIPEFFNLELARQLSGDGFKADVLHAHNVLAHVANLQGVVAGIAALLKEDGIAVIETPYVKDLIDRCEFDTIYHEHLCYYSVTALSHLFRHCNLHIVNVERIPIHGGSIRVFVSRRDQPAHSVREILDEERNWGVDRLDFYARFSDRVEKLRNNLCSLIHKLKADGAKIAVYGASAKGSTLLNYFGLGKNELEFVVDRSSVKQGLFTPGAHLPILPPEALLERRPDYVLLLTWNFRDEILEQQKAYRDAGGKFIIPIPEVEIV